MTILKRGKPLKSKNKLKSKSQLKAKSPIKKTGKAYTKWAKAKKDVTEELEKLGINFCELRGEKCTGNLFLTFAHSRKRRFIETEEQLKEVALLCVSCHEYVEGLPKEEMEAIIVSLILRRTL